MELTPEIISQRIAALTMVYDRQIAKSGQPDYDAALLEMLKKDLAWLRDPVESSKSSAMPEKTIDGSKA